MQISNLLSERETEVLTLLAEGKNNNEISQILTIEICTVKAHVSSIFRKLNVKSRTQAVVEAYKNNWFE